MRVNGDGVVTISLAQKDKRCFPRKIKYEYSFSRLWLVTAGSPKQFVAGVTGKPNRDLHLEVDNIQPGEYYLYA